MNKNKPRCDTDVGSSTQWLENSYYKYIYGFKDKGNVWKDGKSQQKNTNYEKKNKWKF